MVLPVYKKCSCKSNENNYEKVYGISAIELYIKQNILLAQSHRSLQVLQCGEQRYEA